MLIFGKGPREGDRYEGEWVNGDMTGRGVYQSPKGFSYEGQFRKNKPNGEGIKIWNDGSRYEGNWLDGMKSGRGIYAWYNGDRYEGEFRDDKFNGQGVKNGLTAVSTEEIGSMAKARAGASIPGQMEIDTRANSKVAR